MEGYSGHSLWNKKDHISRFFMRNIELAELNFKELLHYGAVHNVKASQSNQIPCSGFCVSCENKVLVPLVFAHDSAEVSRPRIGFAVV